MNWYNEPASWSADKDELHMRVESDTDYWRTTHYGFVRDNGHFYYQERAGDFVASAKITGQYIDLYDQAGLMIWLDDQNWIKTGIEYVEEQQHISAVVTREFSDWSVCPQSHHPEFVYMRMTRQGDAVRIDYSFDDFTYQMLRLAYFPPNEPVQIGLMGAAPNGRGFSVSFEQFTVMAIS